MGVRNTDYGDGLLETTVVDDRRYVQSSKFMSLFRIHRKGAPPQVPSKTSFRTSSAMEDTRNEKREKDFRFLLSTHLNLRLPSLVPTIDQVIRKAFSAGR